VYVVVQSETDASKKKVADIWRGPTGIVDGPRGITTTQRDTGQVEADQSDDEDELEKDDPVEPGVPWDDSHFPLPTTIKVKVKKEPLRDVEWMRPPVSTVSKLYWF